MLDRIDCARDTIAQRKSAFAIRPDVNEQADCCDYRICELKFMHLRRTRICMCQPRMAAGALIPVQTFPPERTGDPARFRKISYFDIYWHHGPRENSSEKSFLFV